MAQRQKSKGRKQEVGICLSVLLVLFSVPRVPRGWEPPLSLFSLDDDDDNERNRAGTRLREAAEKFLAGGGVSSIQMLSLSFNEITNEINRHLSQTSHKDTK